MTMAALKIQSLECIDQNETTQDEPYLNFNGTKIWSGDMDQGDTVNLSHLGPFLFDGSADLSLFEEDNPGFPLFDRNDHVGTVTIHDYDAPGGNFAIDFNLDGHYRALVDVLGVSLT